MPVCQMPFIITNEISEEEKTAWHNARLAEVEAGTYKGKEITPDFEPIKGWKPLKKYGTSPVQIIKSAVYDWSRMGIYPGDYIRETVSGVSYKFIIVRIGKTPYLNSPAALMAADKPYLQMVRGGEDLEGPYDNLATPAQWKNWIYQYTDIWRYCDNFYRHLPDSLSFSILEVYPSCTQYNYERKEWEVNQTRTRVFIPAATELCPSDSSFEGSIHEKAEADYFIPWPKTYINSIDDLSKLDNCWLRTMFCNRRVNKQWSYLICKSSSMEFVRQKEEKIEPILSTGHAHVLPCFCIG